MAQRIINLFDEYNHKPLRRDKFLSRLAKLTGSVVAEMAVLSLFEVNYAHAETLPTHDDRIITESITFPGANTTIKACFAKPTGTGKFPVVLVIHENRVAESAHRRHCPARSPHRFLGLRRSPKKAGVPYRLYIYEGAQHAFDNHTAPTRYDEVAAKLAWDRTIVFLKNNLA